MRPNPSLRELARSLGLSHTTVSEALRDSPRVKAATRERVLKAARDLNRKVPQDIALVGFDDLDMADYIGLTTVCQHLEESGRIAVELLLSRLADPSRPVQHIQLPLTLTERETA